MGIFDSLQRQRLSPMFGQQQQQNQPFPQINSSMSGGIGPSPDAQQRLMNFQSPQMPMAPSPYMNDWNYKNQVPMQNGSPVQFDQTNPRRLFSRGAF